jgi:hypothetical protein
VAERVIERQRPHLPIGGIGQTLVAEAEGRAEQARQPLDV